MSKENWIHMPHPGHFICAYECRFRMNTWVNGYIISTIGEMIRKQPVKDEEFKYDEVGYNRLYETMVFKSEPKLEVACCPYRVADFSELECVGYNSDILAFAGHYAMCEKYDGR